MSCVPRIEQLSIEEILEQIRKEASAQPFSRVERVRDGLSQDSGAQAQLGTRPDACPDACVEKADHLSNDPRPPAIDPDWVWSGAAQDGSLLQDDVLPDLPSVLKRAAQETTHSANVHAFPRPTPSRLSEAFRRVRPPRVATSTAVVAPTSETASVKREMVSFLDTRFKKLGAPPMGLQTPMHPVAAPDITGHGVTHAKADRVEDAQLHALIEALSKTSADALSCSQQSTAEVIRPMLKQWLSENMPRIIEKVLAMEMAENAGVTESKKIG